MNKGELHTLYENKSNIELLLIAMNYDGGCTDDAVEVANSLLSSRYKCIVNPQLKFGEEVARLQKLSQACSVCQNPSVVSSRGFSLCKEPRMPEIGELFASTCGATLAEAVGVGFKLERDDCVDLKFRLCQRCLVERTQKTGSCNERVIIGWEDYYAHPLCELFLVLGYTELCMSE